MKKLISILVALAMMMTLCLTAFAADDDPATGGGDAPAATLTDEQTSKDALLVKYLDLDNGVTNPSTTFTFSFVGVATDTVTKAEADAAVPATAITLTPNEQTVYAGDENTVAASVALKTLAWNFSKPGEYKYIVSEVIPNPEVPGYTYDKSSYTVEFFVDSNKQITNITVQKNDPNGNPGAKEDATHDPTDETDEVVTETKDLRLQGLRFENKYAKALTDETNGVLNITKEIVGTYANPDTAFPFEIVLTKPAELALDDTTTNVVAYKVADGNVVTSAFTGDTLTITGSIKGGEKIMFTKLPAGTGYVVTEKLGTGNVDNAQLYLPSVAGATAASTPAKGADLATVSKDVQDTNFAANNKVDYTNTVDDKDVTPTGILMNNLPYILLAVVAAGGLIAYLMMKRREANSEA